MSVAVRARVAVYGEIDPNLVDGSSVWLQSICQVLASIGGVEVTLLLRRPLQAERRFLLAELEGCEGVEVLDAGRLGLLSAAEALDRLGALERERGPFDRVLLRGQALLAEAAGRERFDGRLWPYAMTGRGMAAETLRALAARSDRVLCQTEAVAEELRQIVPEAGRRLLVAPPMIPDAGPPPQPNGRRGPLRLVYSGKLAPEYCWLETVAAFERLREARPGAELHVLGDKVHRPPEHPGFHAEATRALRETEGLRWHGAVPRGEVHGLLAGCDLALSIRDPGVEAAREISTKVLEYGAAGLPVVLNRAAAYERLLGEDYPLFIDRPQDAAALLSGPALDPQTRAAAAAACHAASAEFTFSRVAARFADQLPPAPTAPMPAFSHPEGAQSWHRREHAADAPARRVLIAGHDLKFTGPIREAIAAAGATVAEDPWQSHTEHDERASRALLEQADTILCEWCLGNAAWYSRNKRPDQRLVVRLHRMELETDHPAKVEMEAVDAMVFVSKHVQEEVVTRFGWDEEQLYVIPNAIDCERLQRPKSREARFSLALIGYVPKLKRLDRALEVLERLREREPRFHMTVVGRPPSDFAWVVSKREEVEAYRCAFARIQKSGLLRGAIDFVPFTMDLPSLFEGIGWIVSTSDIEGHQVTLAEGAASGAVPIILDRPGAADQYPSRWIYADPWDVAKSVASFSGDGWMAERRAAIDHAAGWSTRTIIPHWVNGLGLECSPASPSTPKCNIP